MSCLIPIVLNSWSVVENKHYLQKKYQRAGREGGTCRLTVADYGWATDLRYYTDACTHANMSIIHFKKKCCVYITIYIYICIYIYVYNVKILCASTANSSNRGGHWVSSLILLLHSAQLLLDKQRNDWRGQFCMSLKIVWGLPRDCYLTPNIWQV